MGAEYFVAAESFPRMIGAVQYCGYMPLRRQS
jgi:hypothetical protein